MDCNKVIKPLFWKVTGILPKLEPQRHDHTMETMAVSLIFLPFISDTAV